jgi:hypothetical protein
MATRNGAVLLQRQVEGARTALDWPVKRLPIMTHFGIDLTRHLPYKILNQLFILLCRWVVWMPMMGQYSMPINSGCLHAKRCTGPCAFNSHESVDRHENRRQMGNSRSFVLRAVPPNIAVHLTP